MFASGCSTTNTESNPSAEAERVHHHDFLQSFYHPDYVSIDENGLICFYSKNDQ